MLHLAHAARSSVVLLAAALAATLLFAQDGAKPDATSDSNSGSDSTGDPVGEFDGTPLPPADPRSKDEHKSLAESPSLSIIDLARVVQYQSKTPVLFPSPGGTSNHLGGAAPRIPLLANIDPCPAEFAARVLHANGYRVSAHKTAKGRDLFHVAREPERKVPARLRELAAGAVGEARAGANAAPASQTPAPGEETITIEDLSRGLCSEGGTIGKEIIATLEVRSASVRVRGPWKGAPRETLLAILDAAGCPGVSLRLADGKDAWLFRSRPTPLVFGDEEVIWVRPLHKLDAADALGKLAERLASAGAPKVTAYHRQAVGERTLVFAAARATIDILERELATLDPPPAGDAGK